VKFCARYSFWASVSGCHRSGILSAISVSDNSFFTIDVIKTCYIAQR